MKPILSVVFLLFTFSLNAQFILKGAVKDKNGEPIPGVRVYVDSTTYGVVTDYNGLYFLELTNTKIYPIRFKMLGMADTLIKVAVSEKITILDVTLVDETTELQTVEVAVKKINVANSIIRKVQENKKAMQVQVKNYTCDTYLKTGLEREPRKPDSTQISPSKMSLIESISKTTYIATNTYHEKIVAHHDYSDKIPTKTTSFVDYYQEDI
ncbi:MAG: carboxypeptidase-like regulatory domain-containing protein, partial [Crocinitomix sp.]|nr:carboxypeptidase-like regulatory domain-containing protein [Crocinitomix sp.]